MIERKETPIKHDQDDNNDNNRNCKKIKFAKFKTKNKKSGSKTTLGDGQYYCKKCGTNPTHDTEQCFILNRLAREANSNGNGKAHAKPYSKRTFCREVNSIACHAGKHDGLKIVKSALKREQGKLEKQASKPASQQQKARKKKAAAKRSGSNYTLSDESMNNMDSRIPLKKQYRKKYASRTIRYNSHGIKSWQKNPTRTTTGECLQK
jgi:hypothetical protein